MYFNKYEFSNSEKIYDFCFTNQDKLSKEIVDEIMVELIYYEYRLPFCFGSSPPRFDPDIECIIKFANNIEKADLNKIEDNLINMCKINEDYTYIIDFLEKVPKANFEKIQKVILEYGTEQEQYKFVKNIPNVNLDLFKDCFTKNVLFKDAFKKRYNKFLKDNKAMNNYTVAYVNDFNEVLAKCKEHGLMEGEFPFDKTSIKDSYIRFCNSAREDKSIEAFIKMLAG